MDESPSSQSRKELYPSTLRRLNKSTLPDGLKEMLKDRLEIEYYIWSQKQFPPFLVKEFGNEIRYLEGLFASREKRIKEAFRQNEKFLNIGCGQMVYKRVRNDSNYTIEDWKRDNPINNVMAEYIHKMFAEKGYHIYEETIVFSPNIPILTIRYTLL